MKFENKTFGSVIADFRKIKKISQKKMALDFEISVGQLRSLENDEEKPEPELVLAIADYLGIPFSVLLFTLLTQETFNNKRYAELFEKMKPIIEQLTYVLLTGKPKPNISMEINTEALKEN